MAKEAVFLLGSISICSAAPNILLMMADQMRFDTLGPSNTYNNKLANLEWLASQGAYFKNAYSTTPTCTPARSALLTGLSPWYHGMLGYGNIAQQYPFEWPRWLSDAGWTTVSVGKNHFMSAGGLNASLYRHGFNSTHLYDGLGNGLNTTDGEFDDYDTWFKATSGGKDPLATPSVSGIPLDWNSWEGPGGSGYIYPEAWHPTAWTAAQAVDAIHTLTAATAPWALKVSFHRPHSPYDPPARVLNATSADMLPPQRVGCGPGSGPQCWDNIYATSPDCGPSGFDAWCGSMPSDELTLSRRSYYASLRFVDEQIGTVLAALNETASINNTFIIFISDHGDGQGDHYLWRKGYPYEISSHVPMLVRWPSGYPSAVARGAVIPALTEIRDIAPTILDVAGVQAQGHVLNGSSLACLLRSPSGSGAGCGPASGPWRLWIDLEHDEVYNVSIHWNGGTDGQTKYIFWAMTGQEQLFDLRVDPYEMADVSALPAYASTLQTWRARLVQQYTAEGRGQTWVQDGKLVPRPNSQLYSPNYP